MNSNWSSSNVKFWLLKNIIIIFALLIILFPETSLEGAQSGLLLWFNTVLPTLLPFMIMSNLLVNLGFAHALGRLLYPFMKFTFKVSPEGCYPILIGLLSGMPVGAKTIGDLVEREDITLEEGQYLLSFCNNISPMFIMNFIAISQLGQPSLRFKLLIINFLSGFISGFLYFRLGNSRPTIKVAKKNSYTLHIQETTNDFYQKEKLIGFDFSMLDNAIMNSFEVITKVGGYIILFSIPAQIISSSNAINPLIKIITIGTLEITTGINYIASTYLSLNIKIVLIVAITAFGSVSALAQTNSVINNTRLSISIYLKNKIMQMLIAILLALIII